MPEKQTIQRARKKEKQGRAPSTQASEFVREEMHHIREGKHGARSSRQAVAIGLSKARRAGVQLPPQGKAHAEKKVAHHPSPTRSRAISQRLRGESRASASPRALSEFGHEVSRKRGPTSRRRSAKQAVETKGRAEIRAAAKKAARTRSRAA